MQPDNDQVEHLLEIAGLQDIRNEYALNLSGGEQQKLSLIRALIFSPKLIFVDEGFSNMDIESVAFFEDYILSLRRDDNADSTAILPTTNTTWVIISHQLSNIRRLCERVYFMHDGEVKASGPTGEIFTSSDNAELNKYLQYV